MAIPPIAALEIGTSQTVVLVGELDQARRVRIIGKGVYPTTGVHKGQVVDLQHAKVGVEMALKQAAEESQVDIGRVVLAVSGGHVEASQNQAAVAIMSRDRIVTHEDVEEVTERVKEIQLPDGREVMHTITQNFSLDGQSGIVKPEGLQGSQLLLNMLLIHARRGPVENMRSVAVAAELDVDDIVFSGLCSALAVLTPDQKRNGVAVIDLGGGTTNYLAYAGNVMAAAGSLAVGGEHVTNDLALAFNIPQARAEELKLQHGSAVISPTAGLKRLSVPNEFGKQDQTISLKAFHTVINARVAETLHIVRSRLHDADLLTKLGAGVVFTGGGAALPGLCELGQSIFGVPCAIGEPAVFSPALDNVPNLPAFATAIGLIQYGIRTYHDTGVKDFIRRIFSR
ncbi:MAG: cell division protein FtsA [Kiritimatiellae bacterium]|nr:cell division protein FtsA [Kiritimatiellia bacterium]